LFWGKGTSVLGLDIGSSHIKIVHLMRQGQNWKLENWAIAKTPKDALFDGNIAIKGELVKVLTDTLSKNKFRESKVVTAVSNQRIVTRYITMPPMPENELKEAVHWEAKNHIPIYDENMKIDYKVLGKTHDSRTLLVIAGIARQTAQDYLEVLREAKLKPVAIDIYPVSLFRFFGTSSGIQQPYCIVDLGYSCVKLVIIQAGSIYADSIVPVGLREFESTLVDYFGIGEEELPSFLESFSFASIRDEQEHAHLFYTIKPYLNELINSINRFIHFFDTQIRDHPIGNIILTGGGALWKGMATFIAQETGITTVSELELVNPWLDASDLTQGQLHLLSNAIGLAMRGVMY